jgi:putative ABC transport system permease protein
MDELATDVRQALRALASRPAFTLAAMLTLALGIGGSTAIFSFVEAVLLRPLPYADPGRLVSVANVIPQLRAEMAGGGDYLDWRDRSRSLATITAYSSSDQVTLVSGGEPRRIPAAGVTASFLPTLGIVPAAGRNFLAEEDRPGAGGVALMTAKLWRRLFPGAAPGEERSIELDGSLRAVVGVLPESFVFPGHPEIELLLPLALDEPSERGRGRQHIVQVIARLRPDATAEGARAELAAIQSAAVAAAPAAPRGGMMITGSAPAVPAGRMFNAPAPPPNAPARRPYGLDTYLKVVPLQRALVADLGPALLLFSAAVGLVMMMACANTANLLLARAAARQGEMAVRAALGAGRGRLVRQLLTESGVLALLGGAAGLGVAALLIAAILGLLPPEIAASFRSAAVRVDTRALAFTLALSLATSLLFGLAPALFAARVDAGDGLRAGARAASPGGGRRRVRRLLVGAEVAVAFVLLVGAGLLVRSFVRLTALDPGFRPDQVVTVALELKRQDYPAPAAQLGFYERLLERARTLPGVEAAAAGDSLPLKPFSMVMMGAGAADQPVPEPGRGPELALCAVTPDYFRALGITLRGGRPFLESDRAGSPEVAIVNETLARRLWGEADPVGKSLRLPRPGGPVVATVVGVVADVRHEGLETPPRGAAYRPFAQDPRPFAFLVLRAPVDPARLVTALRHEVAALDRGLAVHDVATMERRLSDATAARRFNTALVGAFGLVALLLSAVGLYGVMAQSVTERTRELGIRIAIGAAPRQVRALVLRQGLAMAAGGAAVGAFAAFAASRALKGALYGVEPADAVTFAAVPVILLAVCALACALPARRATRVDPAVALRAE